MIGHVGDGNFHIFTGVDPSIPEGPEASQFRLLVIKFVLAVEMFPLIRN